MLIVIIEKDSSTFIVVSGISRYILLLLMSSRLFDYIHLHGAVYYVPCPPPSSPLSIEYIYGWLGLSIYRKMDPSF